MSDSCHFFELTDLPTKPYCSHLVSESGSPRAPHYFQSDPKLTTSQREVSSLTRTSTSVIR